MVDVDVRVSSPQLSHLEELAWAADKRLRVISTIILFENSYSTEEQKNKAILNLFVLLRMWSLVMYSNCFEIVSTLILQIRLI